MNFSKLLCLVLVYSEQFGQVLATVQTGEECKGTAGTTETCKRKKDKAVKLTIAGTANNPVTWKKGTTPISAQAAKYALDVDKNKILTILNLKEGDEGTYTAEGTSPVEKFQVQVVPVCTAQESAKVTCNGKLGGELELKMDSAATTFEWYKEATKITTDSSKYGPVNEITLTILNLADADEAAFKGSASGKTYEFAVQVAPICTGSSATPKTCKGTLNKDLVLKVGSTATKKVVWKKDNKPLGGDKYVKSGTDDIKLRITNLVANDAGTYTASYNAADEESFTVNIPGVSGTNAGGAKKESTENGKDNSGGGGSSNSGTDQVNLGEGKGTGKGAGDHGGGVGGLSYSPALLVTVTLVHLLLQLAA